MISYIRTPRICAPVFPNRPSTRSIVFVLTCLIALLTCKGRAEIVGIAVNGSSVVITFTADPPGYLEFKDCGAHPTYEPLPLPPVAVGDMFQVVDVLTPPARFYRNGNEVGYVVFGNDVHVGPIGGIISCEAQSCEAITRNAVQFSVTADGLGMQGTFTPNDGLTLAEAAQVCGYDHFNWYQLVVYDDDPNRPTKYGVQPTVPYLDPPLGGWDYQSATGGDDQSPGYWNETSGELSYYTGESNLLFFDYPGMAAGATVRFRTGLAGVAAGGVFTPIGPAFTWEASSVGNSVRKNTNPTNVQSGSITLLDTIDTALLPAAEREVLETNGFVLPSPPCKITGITSGGGGLTLSLSNLAPGNPYSIEESSDLAVWTNIFSFFAPAATTNWSPSVDALRSQSFYRVKNGE